MSQSIMDQRVIEMTFDNRQFEKNIQQSIDSLDKLDKSINKNGIVSGINKFSKSIDNLNNNGIASIAMAAQKSFSAMEIAGMTVIQHLTNSFIKLGSNIWNSTIGQIKAGGMKRALNIEQASFLLEGLGLDVAQIKEDAMFAVEGTAYGFDEAAKAAASFGASGVKAGEDMKRALLGVSGVAAMTGRDYESIANIFTTIASNGKLMTMQLRQFSAAGLNVSAAMAKYLGKTEEEINDMVTKGKIDFKTFAQAMNDTFGEHAKDANKTFTGSLSNVKAALSRIGEGFATPYIENMIPVFNKLRDVLNDVKAALKPIYEDFEKVMKVFSDFAVSVMDRLRESGAITNVIYGIRHILLGLLGVFFAFRDALKEVFPGVNDISEAFRNLTLRLVPTEEKYKKMVDVFKNTLSILKNLYELIKPIGETFLNTIVLVLPYVSTLLQYISVGISTVSKFTDSIKDSIRYFFEWIKSNEQIKKVLSVIFGAFIMLSQIVITAKDNLVNFINVIQNGGDGSVLSNIIINLIGFVQKAIDFLKEFVAWVDWGKMAITFFSAVTVMAIWQVVNVLKRVIIYVYGFFTGIMRIVSGIGSLIGSLSAIFSTFNGLLRITKYVLIADIMVRIAVSLIILAGALKLLSTISAQDLVKSITAIALLGGVLSALFAVIGEIYKKVPWTSILAAVPMMTATLVGLALMVVSVIALAQIPWQKLLTGLLGMAGILVIIAGFTKYLTTLESGFELVGLMEFAAAIAILSYCIKLISDIEFGAILKAIIGIGLLMLLVSKFQWQVEGIEGIDPSGYIKMAATIAILSYCIKQLSDIPWTSMIKAIAGMAAMMGLIRWFVDLGNMTNTLQTKGFIEWSATMVILTLCVKMLSEIPWTSLVKAELGLAGLLFIVEQFVNVNRVTTSFETTGFIKFAATIAILSLCLKLLSDIPWTSLVKAELGMAGLLVMIGVFVNAEGMSKGLDPTGYLKLLAVIAVTTLCIKVLSDIPWTSLVKAELGLAGLLFIVDQFIQCNRMTTALDSAGFLQLAGSIAILALAVRLMSGLDPLSVAIGVAAVGAMLAMVHALQKASQGMAGVNVINFMIMASAIVVISMAVAMLSLLDPESVFAAAISMAALTAALGYLTNAANGLSVEKALSMAAFATICVAIAGSIRLLANVPWYNMIAPVVAMSIMIHVLVAVSNELSRVSAFDAQAVVILSSTMLVLAASLWILKDVEWDTILAGTLSMSVVLYLLLGAVVILNQFSITAGTAASLVILAASLIPLALSLKLIAGIPSGDIIKASIAMAALVGVLMIFAAIAGIPIVTAGLAALCPVLLSFAAAALSFGVSTLLIAESFKIFVDSLTNLAELTKEDVEQVLENMNLFVTGLGTVAINLAAQGPAFAQALTAIFGAIITAIGNLKIKIADTVINVIVTVIQKLMEAFPKLLEAFGDMLIAISEWFKAHEQEIYDIGYNIGKGLSNGIIGGLAGISDAIYEYIDDQFVGSAASSKAIEEQARATAETYSDAFTKWFNYYDAGTVSAEQLIEGMRIGLENGMYTQEEIMRELAARGLEGYCDELGIHSPSLEMIKNGEYTIEGVIEGIKNGEYTLYEAMAAMGSSAASAFLSQFGGIESLMDQINGYSDGVNWRSQGSHMAGYDQNGNQITVWQKEGFKSLDEYVEHHQTEFASGMFGHYSESAEEAADADKDFEEANKSLSSSLGDVSKASGKATKETDKLKDSVKSALDIFSGFDAQLDLTSKDVLRSFSDQLVGVQVWSKELEALAGRGIAKELLNELAEAGPSALNRIHALYSMSEDQLSLFNKMYEQKLSLEKSTADEIRASFGQLGDKSGDEVGQAVGDGIAEGAKEGTAKATEYVEQFIDDGKRATDMVEDVSSSVFQYSGGHAGRIQRWKAEGYESAQTWEEAHRKACTKMVPVIAKDYEQVAEAATESVSGSTDTVINEMEQGVIDAHKIGAEYEYINGVIIPNTIKDSIKEATPGIAAIFGEMGYQSMEAFEHMLNVEDAISMVEMFQAGLEGSITSSLKLFDEVKEKEDISAEEMLKRMKENVKNIGKWANDLQTLASRGISEGLLNELQALGPEGADKVHAFTKMTDAQLQQANNAFAASAALPKQVSDRITKSYAEAGMNTTLGFVEGIDPTAAEEVMTALGTYSLAALKEALDIHSPSGKMMEAGMYTVAGLVQGITDGLAQITEVGAEMGSALITSVLAAPEVISEKVTEFFTHLGDIFVGGIKKFGESEAMITFRDTVVDMLNMSLDDILIEPTIRPVIDFESMGDSLGVINGMFNRGFNISPAVGKADNAFGANKTDYTGYLKDMTNLLKQTNEEVAGIRTDVNRLDRDMAELTVNLDGYSVGKLVSPYVNRNLGQTYVNNKRRTM